MARDQSRSAFPTHIAHRANGTDAYSEHYGWEDSGHDGATALSAEGVANGLGWFSVALGLAQLTAPGGVARLVGIPDGDRSRRLMRLMGARELASGVGILVRPRPAGWLWFRVAGDVLDLTLLGTALRQDETDSRRIGAAAVAVAGVAALDAVTGRRLGARDEDVIESPAAIEIRRAITVNASVEDVYGFWRRFSNLPRFMLHLETVEELDERRSRWTVKAPAGLSISWVAEIVEDLPNELIAWRSTSGNVAHAGMVHFREAPGSRGTEVRVDLRYVPPAGAVGALIARLFGEEPGQQVRDDLRAFKQVIETGEVVRSEASPRGPRQQRQRPARAEPALATSY